MSTACETALGCLFDIQRSDGGWAYSTNSSWTEPTCYAIMALRASGNTEPVTTQAIGRASEWLARRQRRDGGWSPGPAVEKSTHVTSLGVLALSDAPGYDDIVDRGVQWLLTEGGAQTPFLSRMVRFATGESSPAGDRSGWPWFPGAAAWVIPTSLSICALARQQHGRHARDIAVRVAEARRFLLSRRCPDHGWNHGGAYRKEETPISYPETTGLALLALAGLATPYLEPSIRCGEQHARDPTSSEGASWLRLGLSAQGRKAPAPPVNFRDWTVNQVALRIITHAGEAGHNPFISHA